MIPISSTQRPPLKFNPVGGAASQKVKISTNKIGWVHSISNKPGASFDIVIRDARGHVMFQRPNCKVETKEFGQFMGIDAHIGEEVEVSLENIQGAEEIDLFLN